MLKLKKFLAIIMIYAQAVSFARAVVPLNPRLRENMVFTDTMESLYVDSRKKNNSTSIGVKKVIRYVFFGTVLTAIVSSLGLLYYHVPESRKCIKICLIDLCIKACFSFLCWIKP
jgi:hypothetical protein